ncbi:MAG: adenosylcobinamide-phosphate synthase CbiB [Candidatus Accumulibacter sp.]|nr:adenosylcobinamide-phosphate synthase CbiB [Accumulibacter sp.]
MSFPSISDFLLTFPHTLLPPLAAIAGVVLDRLLGEPKYAHPLIAFGRLADMIESCFNRGGDIARRASGLAAWSFAVFPWTMLTWFGTRTLHSSSGHLLDIFLLYFALGGRSLTEHATRIGNDLVAGNLTAAREHVGWIVSRDTSALDEPGIAKACVESTLENGNDAIFGVLFWFMLLGGTGAVLFRLSNTLDAMWGYKNARFRYFGWAAARIDDALNYAPARLTALSYALLGQTRRALDCWRRQAPLWESPNAGPVMSSGAGSLGVTLGGPAVYHGQTEERPQLGEGRAPGKRDIQRALTLVRRTIALWLAVYFFGGLFSA